MHINHFYFCFHLQIVRHDPALCFPLDSYYCLYNCCLLCIFAVLKSNGSCRVCCTWCFQFSCLPAVIWKPQGHEPLSLFNFVEWIGQDPLQTSTVSYRLLMISKYRQKTQKKMQLPIVWRTFNWKHCCYDLEARLEGSLTWVRRLTLTLDLNRKWAGSKQLMACCLLSVGHKVLLF